MPDPTMPRVIPPEVERELRLVLHEYRVRPNPIDVYMAIRDALEHGRPPRFPAAMMLACGGRGKRCED